MWILTVKLRSRFSVFQLKFSTSPSLTQSPLSISLPPSPPLPPVLQHLELFKNNIFFAFAFSVFSQNWNRAFIVIQTSYCYSVFFFVNELSLLSLISVCAPRNEALFPVLHFSLSYILSPSLFLWGIFFFDISKFVFKKSLNWHNVAIIWNKS